MKIGLVLGAGGTVGMAYHAGVLRALEVEAGFVPNRADVIIGTSAGSVIGAYLRTGWTTEDFWALASDLSGGRAETPEILSPRFTSPVDAVRRGVGSAFVLGRSILPWPLQVPEVLRRVFPGGLFTMAEGRRRFADELPDAWPDLPLWLCTVDIVSGRRIVLGRERAPKMPLPRAVLASCAIPGVYEPIRVGKRVLVDGGARSTTNLDLAAKAECDVIIGVAPMAFDTGVPPGPLGQLVRRLPARQLSGEVAAARRKHAEVLLLRPSAAELRVHGLNFMRPTGLQAVAQAAYDATAETLRTDRFRSILADLPAA
ncbi:MAG TPA: patatin-like phospholipase family protein [Acidimicrobiales bacterium]|nr:patatin-like phospholipase family protein [Acidimicrobiales bacterium]